MVSEANDGVVRGRRTPPILLVGGGGVISGFYPEFTVSKTPTYSLAKMFRSRSLCQYLVEQREQVLVRLKVEHSDFATLNNQRFGSQFMGKVWEGALVAALLLCGRAHGERVKSLLQCCSLFASHTCSPYARLDRHRVVLEQVANPSSLLLFYRRRTASTAGSSSAGGVKDDAMGLSDPIRPDDLDELRVEVCTDAEGVC